MKAHGHFLLLSALVVTLCLALGGCKRQPPALAATPPPVVMVSQPVEREVRDYYEYTGRTAAVDAVEVRARVSGYLLEPSVPVPRGIRLLIELVQSSAGPGAAFADTKQRCI